MDPEHTDLPPEYIEDATRAREQAEAEKPHRDEAAKSQARAEAAKDPFLKRGLKEQADLHVVLAKQASARKAREQAMAPVEDEDPIKHDLPPADVEGFLSTITKKFEAPDDTDIIDGTTVAEWKQRGIPLYVIAETQRVSLSEVVANAEQAMVGFREHNIRGDLDQVEAAVIQDIEDAEEALKIGKYDKRYPNASALQKQINEGKWNLELISRAMNEDVSPAEQERIVKAMEVKDMYNEVDRYLAQAIQESPESTHEVLEQLKDEWLEISEQLEAHEFDYAWPDTMAERIQHMKERLLQLYPPLKTQTK